MRKSVPSPVTFKCVSLVVLLHRGLVGHSTKCTEAHWLGASTCSKLVGFGTDGASANVAAAGLKGLVEK